jgi:hypothetical protein
MKGGERLDYLGDRAIENLQREECNPHEVAKGGEDMDHWIHKDRWWRSMCFRG